MNKSELKSTIKLLLEGRRKYDLEIEKIQFKVDGLTEEDYNQIEYIQGKLERVEYDLKDLFEEAAMKYVFEEQ